eukprot:11609212-Alexandrium_andersonii.AAC.1
MARHPWSHILWLSFYGALVPGINKAIRGVVLDARGDSSGGTPDLLSCPGARRPQALLASQGHSQEH